MKELDELELDGLAEALEGEGYDVGAIRVRQAKELIISLESQVTRIKDLSGDLWNHMHPNSKDCDVCKVLKQRLKDEGVVK